MPNRTLQIRITEDLRAACIATAQKKGVPFGDWVRDAMQKALKDTPSAIQGDLSGTPPALQLIDAMKDVKRCPIHGALAANADRVRCVRCSNELR